MDSPAAPTDTHRRISPVRCSSAQNHGDRIHKHFPPLRCVMVALDLQGGIDPPTMHIPDFFAFSLTIFLAIRTMEPGIKIPTILKTLVEGATLYFLVIFTSHLLLEMTLLFGRVNVPVPPSGPPLMTSNASI